MRLSYCIRGEHHTEPCSYMMYQTVGLQAAHLEKLQSDPVKLPLLAQELDTDNLGCFCSPTHPGGIVGSGCTVAFAAV